MLLIPDIDPRDQSGTTLMEVVVALGAGIVVIFALSTIVISTMHSTYRTSARVDANQRARLALNQIVDQLHSACVAPQIAPIKKESSGTRLIFVHKTGSEVSPLPVKSEIVLSGGTLTQYDYPATGGAPPEWSYPLSPTSSRQLMTKVAATAASGSIFTYYKYVNGKISTTPLTTPLESTAAATTVQVNVALTASPLSTPVRDTNAATQIQGSALLKLTPPAFTGGVDLPCQ
jgi:Tfp pilus assembly protein PilW